MTLRMKTLATTALLLSLAAAPQAMATTYTFTTTANNQLNGSNALTPAQRAINFYFVTDATPQQTTGTANILGVYGTVGSAWQNNIFNQTVGGFAPYFGTINLSNGRLTGIEVTFDRSTSGGIYDAFPWTLSGATYAGAPAGALKATINDADLLGGSSVATLTQVPEIDGGMLPRGLMVLSGIFLMLFGRKKAEDLA